MNGEKESAHRDQRHEGAHTRQQASINSENDKAVDDGLRAAEASAGALKEEDERHCDSDI